MSIDIIFHILAFKSFNIDLLAISFFVNLALSFIIQYIYQVLPKGINIFVVFLIILFFGIYAFVQLQFKNFLTTYYSLKAFADGGFRVENFVGYFVKRAELVYYLTLVPSFIYLLIVYFLDKKPISKYYFLYPLISILIIVASLLTTKNQLLKDALINQDNLDTVISNMGINGFLFEDISSIFIKHKTPELIIEEEIIEEEIIEEEVKEEVINYKREIDDSKWINEKDKEEDQTIKTIDEYLLSRKIEDKNEMTGIFEDYNFIYFLVESLDYSGIDKDLTPTIYKMIEDGYFFDKHYTPVLTCGTGDSEFVAMTSLMSYGSSCTVYSAINNNLHASLAGLFKNKGYSTQSYHNWDDQFYNRTTLHESYGIDEYLDIHDLNIKLVEGWQSDSELARLTIENYVDDEKFFTFYVTSTMHWPYDISSYYGNKNIEEINKYHSDYPIELKRMISKTMEFDKMLEVLMEELEKAGKLDKTVFCFWPDHHPFNIPASYLINHTSLVDRSEEYGFNLGPFVIYNSANKGKKISQVCSTYDQLPTVANMFNLNYDPRLYAGNDIFNHNTKAMFPNGDWISNEGIYYNSSATFKQIGNKSLSDNQIKNIDNEIKNITRVFRSVVSSDYFNKREFLINPKLK